MPRPDGTGPRGGGGGQGGGQGRSTGRNRMGGSWGAGPGGDCVCPSCGATVPHVRSEPCVGKDCPQCGAKMVRE